jgi:hypothetical protein
MGDIQIFDLEIKSPNRLSSSAGEGEQEREMSTQLASQTTQSLRIAYQPFLSTSRSQALLSRLSALPHTFLPVPSTSLKFPPSAQIILLSRGGKPFAPAENFPSRTAYKALRERDWNTSAGKYVKLLQQWEELNAKLPILVSRLRAHFPDEALQSRDFSIQLRRLMYTGDLKDTDSVKELVRKYNSLRKAQLRIHSLLAKTQGHMKVSARRTFSFENLRLREYVLEDHRDMLDLFRLQLEKRYKGMALVRSPNIAEPKPWILLPEDPEGAWGETFPDHVSNLISLAQERFLMSPEEQEQALERDANEYLAENGHRLLRIADEELTKEKLMQSVKEKLRNEKSKLWKNDAEQLVLPEFVGKFEGDLWREPRTVEDMAVLEIGEKQLVKRGAWRVAD